MKTRSDFVTNSSSSSFILRSKDVEKYIPAAVGRAWEEGADLYKDIYDDYWDRVERLAKYTEERFETLCREITPIEEQDAEDVCECFEWYFEDLLEITLGYSPQKDADENEFKSKGFEGFLQTPAFNGLSEETAEKAAELVVLYVMSRENWDLWGKQTETINSLTAESCECSLYDIVEGEKFDFGFYSDRVIYALTVNNFEKLARYIQKYADKTAGAILGDITGAKYMFFDDEEIDWYIYTTLNDAEECLLCCNHMG